MSNPTYTEPELSILVLDFQKPETTRLCLESVKRHVKFPVKVIYLHNGPADYPRSLLEEGLVDQLIQTKENSGLGIGTRNLFAASFSPYSLSLQNDQIFGRDFTQQEFDHLKTVLKDGLGDRKIGSISLAGGPCGQDIFSERAFIMETAFYQRMEKDIPLSYGGAGPYAHEVWREEQVQRYYHRENLIHFTNWPILVMDNGSEAKRQNPDGSLWLHYPDTKALFLVKGPVKEQYVYPKLSKKEWDFVIENQSWPPGQIPENEVKDSFHVWH